MEEISRQLDDYEQRYGPTDRTDFDGEFFVPVEIRNRIINSSKGSLRIHGGLLTISRSRTFLSLSSNNRSSIHNSTPDLSRSVPNTPGSNHKLSLTSSYDSVLEENEEDGMMVFKKASANDSKAKGKHVKQIFSNSSKDVTKRRKSEDLLESSQISSEVPSLIAVQKQQQHVRITSDHAYRLIPRVKQPVNEITENFNIASQTSKSRNETGSDSSIPKWGNIRGSNSFATDMNISSLSTYTIPRVSLGNINKSKERQHQFPSAFIMKHDTDDSIA